MSTSLTRQQELTTLFESQLKAKQLVLPTADSDVRNSLRARGEPQQLFGEGPYERRERLRGLVAQDGVLPVISTSIAQTGVASAVAAELFFTEGTSALVQARRAVARYSIPRSYIRSRNNKRNFEETNSIHEEAQRNRFRDFLEKQVSVLSSQVGDVRPLTACRFSGDQTLLATAAFSGTLKIWETATATLKETLTDAHPTRVHGLAWRPGWTARDKPGQGALASCDAAGSILLWGQSVDDSAWRPLRSFLGHEDRVNRLSFHPSGRYLASTSHDETWRWWDVEAGTELLLQEGHSRAVYGIAHHPDGSLLASSDLGGIIRIWDLRTGRTVVTFTGHVKQVLSLDFNPINSHILASSSGDRTVRLWDLRKKDSFETIPCHANLVSTVMFEPKEGRFLLTASHDKEARLWSTDDYRCFKVLAGHEGFIMCADIAPESKYIATASYDRTVKLWGATSEMGED